MVRRIKGSKGYSSWTQDYIYKRVSKTDVARLFHLLHVCMYLRFKFMCVICMYVCMDYTLKLSVMAESGRSFELR